MKTVNLPDELFKELVNIVDTAVGERTEWLQHCEEFRITENNCLANAADDLTKAKNILYVLYDAMETREE